MEYFAKRYRVLLALIFLCAVSAAFTLATSRYAALAFSPSDFLSQVQNLLHPQRSLQPLHFLFCAIYRASGSLQPVFATMSLLTFSPLLFLLFAWRRQEKDERFFVLLLSALYCVWPWATIDLQPASLFVPLLFLSFLAFYLRRPLVEKIVFITLLIVLAGPDIRKIAVIYPRFFWCWIVVLGVTLIVWDKLKNKKLPLVILTTSLVFLLGLNVWRMQKEFAQFAKLKIATAPIWEARNEMDRTRTRVLVDFSTLAAFADFEQVQVWELNKNDQQADYVIVGRQNSETLQAGQSVQQIIRNQRFRIMKMR